MIPQKRGIFVTVQEEMWPPVNGILGWWANCLMGIEQKMTRTCLVENYTTEALTLVWAGCRQWEIPPMDYFKFPIKENE